MEPTIDISNLPQTPAVTSRIVDLAYRRQSEIAAKWKVSQPTLSYQIQRLKEGKRLSPKTWCRWAHFYMESLQTQRAVEQYLNS